MIQYYGVVDIYRRIDNQFLWTIYQPITKYRSRAQTLTLEAQQYEEYVQGNIAIACYYKLEDVPFYSGEE